MHTYNVAYVRRDRALRELPGDRRRRQLHESRASRTQSGLDQDDGPTSASPAPIRAWSMIDGCFSSTTRTSTASRTDLDWPGTNPNPVVDQAIHPTPVLFTSPVSRWAELFDNRVRDRPARGSRPPRLSSIRPSATRTTGANCVDPPYGAQFYPFYTTGIHDETCTWQEGGELHPRNDRSTSAAARRPSTVDPCCRLLVPPSRRFQTAELSSTTSTAET